MSAALNRAGNVLQKIKYVRACAPLYRYMSTTATGTGSGLDWQKQAEAEAIAASKGRSSVQAGMSPNQHLMNKLEHEFKEERVARK
tara:strand:+ start:251 stop:508 length:258 start_codon:yes stop_codon:yes gene_type:complete